METEFMIACGIFEIIGSMGVWNNGGGRKLATIELQFKREDVLIRFQKAVGGGTIHHREDKDTYIWRIRGNVKFQKELIARMWPHLSTSRREDCLKQLREINKAESLFK